MSLKVVFNDAADTIFNVFSSLIVPVTYVSVYIDGFDVNDETEYTNVSMIQDTFSEKDVRYLPFYSLIQPTDVKGLIKGRELRDKGILEHNTTDIIKKENGTKYSIVAYTTDPAEALYTFLLRKV
jgi:hypothetical protein